MYEQYKNQIGCVHVHMYDNYCVNLYSSERKFSNDITDSNNETAPVLA